MKLPKNWGSWASEHDSSNNYDHDDDDDNGERHRASAGHPSLSIVMDHIPVLLHEAIALLDPKPGEVFADVTAGGGGHAAAIAGARQRRSRLTPLVVAAIARPLRSAAAGSPANAPQSLCRRTAQ